MTMTASSALANHALDLGATLPIVRGFEPRDEAAWEAFVFACPETSFFHRAGWRRVIESSIGHRAHYRCAWRGAALVGILPLIEVKSRWFGHALVSLAFGVAGGIAAGDDGAVAALAEDAARLGETLGVDFVELRHETPRDIPWLAKPELYFTFRRTLSQDEAANLKAVPRKKRADLRKAIDNKTLRVDTGVDPKTFYRIYAESLRNLGTPVLPRRFYAAVAAEFGNAVELSTIGGAEGPVAALMTYFFKDVALPYYGGATPAARPLHAYDLIYWRLMGRAIERGCQVFDFGRSKRGTGAFDYKTYWGFEPTPLHYQFHLVRQRSLPEINPLNPKYRLMVDSWKKLPLPIANTLGPPIARQIA
ncbi:MAG TPA: FemAB family XrtA/PEP-CTERM system-associated protein [Stellaceae bacterium]|nr:FemAB family XrtA/PEP-CTERM system-associated protein [Stellaceae bacterium]